MISVEEALARLLAPLEALPPEQVGIAEGIGRVLAEDLGARRTQPPFAVSAMDGYAVRADDLTVTIKDHKFSPAELKVPANKRVEITVINDDATPEEFESKPMKVEKVIPGKSKGVVRIGPLKPGRYPFVGEFHEATAKGVVIAE